MTVTYILMGIVGVLSIGIFSLWRYSMNLKGSLEKVKHEFEIHRQDAAKEKMVLNEQIKLLSEAITNPDSNSDIIDRLWEGSF